MSATSIQHKDWYADVLINHPEVNGGNPTIITLQPVERRHDAEGKVLPVSEVELLQQSMFAGIVRLFGNPFTGYTANGLKRVEEDVLPALRAAFNVPGLVWKDHLSFRIYKKNPATGEIWESSGTGYNPETGEFVNPWLTYDEFMLGQSLRNTSLVTTKVQSGQPVKVAKESAPMDYSFLTSVTKTAPAAATAGPVGTTSSKRTNK